MGEKNTFHDAISYFADPERCREFVIQLRWLDGVVRCPRCKGDKHCWVEKQRLWKCYAGHARGTFTLKTGTIFEDSAVPLEKWLPAICSVLDDGDAVTSHELHRALGVTQKTAWFMIQRIRLAMQGAQAAGGGKASKSEGAFPRLREAMKHILAVPKWKVDVKLMEVKAGSSRIGNPKAPGRKAERSIHG